MGLRLFRNAITPYPKKMTEDWKTNYDNIYKDFEEYSLNHPEYSEPINAFLDAIANRTTHPEYYTMYRISDIIEETINDTRCPSEADDEYYYLDIYKHEATIADYVEETLGWEKGLNMDDVHKIQDSFWHYGFSLNFETIICVWFNRSVRDVNKGGMPMEEEMNKGYKPVGENPFIEAVLHIVVPRMIKRNI
jgi:hypothetical protein